MKFSPLAAVPLADTAGHEKSEEGTKDVETGHSSQSGEKLQVAIRRDDFLKEDYCLPNHVGKHASKLGKVDLETPVVPILTQRADFLNKEREKANLLAADRPITGLLATFTGHTGPVNTCLVCKIDEEEYLFTGSTDCTIRVYSVVSGQCLRVLEGHTDMITSLRVFELVGTTVLSEKWR
jgi:WD40 repeat protein